MPETSTPPAEGLVTTVAYRYRPAVVDAETDARLCRASWEAMPDKRRHEYAKLLLALLRDWPTKAAATTITPTPWDLARLEEADASERGTDGDPDF